MTTDEEKEAQFWARICTRCGAPFRMHGTAIVPRGYPCPGGRGEFTLEPRGAGLRAIDTAERLLGARAFLELPPQAQSDATVLFAEALMQARDEALAPIKAAALRLRTAQSREDCAAALADLFDLVGVQK